MGYIASEHPSGRGSVVNPRGPEPGPLLSFTDGNNGLRIPICATLCWNFRETDNTTKI